MPLPCPYGDYVTSTETPTEEAAALFEHLGSEHLPEEKNLFIDLAARIRGASLPNR